MLPGKEVQVSLGPSNRNKFLQMKLYNSLTKKKEKYVPLETGKAGVYTCGPTVYDQATIGNWRTYVTADLLVRTLGYCGYLVRYVMNITDVGHLTGDNFGDASSGDDRLEKSAKKAGKSAWEIAEYYTEDFYQGFNKLNLSRPDIFCKATDHIAEQINLVRKIEAVGCAYKIADGIYFDTQAFEKKGNKYGELSTLDKIKEGSRVEINPEKKDARDFALWKFSPADQKRDMEWESPWGVGFPGWHLECSAMSMQYLGEQFDIHVGGEDLRSTHHPNEIAQSEAASGKKPFVRYWLHGAFLTVDGGRMGKSLGNAYTLGDLESRGYKPLALRYFYLAGHYRKQLNFTWKALEAAASAYEKLSALVINYRDGRVRVSLAEEKLDKITALRNLFTAAVEDDLNSPQALSVVWETVKSNIPDYDKYDLLLDYDQVLGLGLSSLCGKEKELPHEIRKLIKKRESLRKQGKFSQADKIREQVIKIGYSVSDARAGK